MLNCIRALCNTNFEVGFKIGKDISLPETYIRSIQILSKSRWQPSFSEAYPSIFRRRFARLSSAFAVEVLGEQRT
jgi:hypothetical protein